MSRRPPFTVVQSVLGCLLALVAALALSGCGADAGYGNSGPEVQRVQSDLRAALGPRLATVVFAPNSAALSPDEQSEVAEVASLLIENNGAPIVISGDRGRGDTTAGRSLARRRAAAVRDHLRGLGIAPVMMRVEVANGGAVPAARIRVPGEQGQVLYRRWENTGAIGLEQFEFSSSPDHQALLPSLASPVDVCDRCMSELSGLVVAPRTGKYRFWLSADDEAALDLSTDRAFENLVQLTRLDPGQWTLLGEFDRYPRQRSRVVRLRAGRQYAIRVRAHEGVGGDHVVVHWSPPGASRRPIPESALRAGS